MNSEKLLNYMNNPRSLTKGSLEEIQNLLRLFPYSQNIQHLYLLNLSVLQDLRFGEQLQKTATYAPDRKLLKNKIEALKENPKKQEEEIFKKPVEDDFKQDSFVEEIEQLLVPEPVIEEAVVQEDEVLKEEPVIAKERVEESSTNEADELDEEMLSERNKVRSKAELLQLVKNRLKEIEVEKAEENERSKEKVKEVAESSLENKMDLIDKFIRSEPSISRPEKIAFFNPDTAAQESLSEDGGYVTETLAKIYVDQGNYRKAIEIYQILSLNNSEKSSYFAALIRELKNKIN